MVGVLLPPSIAGADQLVQSMPIQSVGCRSGYGCDRITELREALEPGATSHPDGADLPVGFVAVPSTGSDRQHSPRPDGKALATVTESCRWFRSHCSLPSGDFWDLPAIPSGGDERQLSEGADDQTFAEAWCR